MVVLLAILVPLAWLAGSVFVALYEPTGLTDTTLELVRTAEGRPRWQLVVPVPAADRAPPPRHFLDSPPYGCRGSSIWDPGGPDERGCEHLLARGRLDPARGTFPLALGLLLWGEPPPRSIRLEVTRDADWGGGPEGEDWVVLGAADTVVDGRWQWASIESAAPAGTVAWKYVIVAEDGGESATGRTLTRPSDRIERLLEDLAAYGIFRWLATDESTE